MTNDGHREIPPSVVAELLESAGIQRGTPLRLLACHASESPLAGTASAKLLATEWKGSVFGPDGLLRIGSAGMMRIDFVDWVPDPVLGGMQIDVYTIRIGQGAFILHTP